jgi:hypothetical protein
LDYQLEISSMVSKGNIGNEGNGQDIGENRKKSYICFHHLHFCADRSVIDDGLIT